MEKLKQLYCNPIGKDHLTLAWISIGFAVLSLLSTFLFLSAGKDVYAAFTISVTAVNTFTGILNYRAYREWKKSNNK